MWVSFFSFLWLFSFFLSRTCAGRDFPLKHEICAHSLDSRLRGGFSCFFYFLNFWVGLNPVMYIRTQVRYRQLEFVFIKRKLLL